ncbi:MAG: prolipoprotein diacylglyceryl transferase family protein [Byssovorax sp.]
MRPALVLWLLGHGLPGWLAPDYAALVGVAGIVGAYLFLRLARRDRADVAVEARALALGYAAALLGGYLFEAIRAIPEAIAEGSWAPMLFVGRAAYGGLLAGVAACVGYLSFKRRPIAPFLDRITVVLGVTFFFVRAGCFLAGCDYGVVTAGPLGVRFPAGSPAAIDHAALGWIRAGAPSLPVHATQLYESLVGVVATLIAYRWLRRGERDGRAFLAWILVYATGRFAIERLRGDAERGVYLGLSTAQLVSIGLLAAALVVIARRRRTLVSAAVAAGILACAPSAARADTPPDPPPVRTIVVALPEATPPAPTPPAPAPPAAPEKPKEVWPRRYVTLRASFGGALVLGNPSIPSGGVAELAGLFRVPLDGNRFEIGLETRLFRNAVATHYALGLPLQLVFGVARHFEISTLLAADYTWIVFDSPYFRGTNAWSARAELGFQFPINSRASLGLSPLCFEVLTSRPIGIMTTYEPRAWFGLAL